MRPAPHVLLCAALIASCEAEPGQYDVIARVPGGPERARRVELVVLASCAEVPDPGHEAADVLLRVWAIDGEAEPLGKLVEGRYGLYGRAWDGECVLYAAGCDAFVIEGGGQGTIEVILGELEEPRGCADDSTCEDGQCREAGSGSCSEMAAEICAASCPCAGDEDSCNACRCSCWLDCPQSEEHCN